jgi:hypothetical protein
VLIIQHAPKAYGEVEPNLHAELHEGFSFILSRFAAGERVYISHLIGGSVDPKLVLDDMEKRLLFLPEIEPHAMLSTA